MSESAVTLGWLDMLKYEVFAKHPDGTQGPVYVYGLRCGSPEAIARWEELAKGKTA
jgi:hypothetical protein